MTPKIRNIVIFVTIGAALLLIYIFFLKPSAPVPTLVSSSSGGAPIDTAVADQNSSVARDFLTLLLSVKNITLNDAIFADNAFASLRDSSIVIVQDTVEGRPNPFAPLGSDGLSEPIIIEEEAETTGTGTGTEADTGTVDTGAAGAGSAGTTTP